MFLTKFSALILASFAISAGLSLPKNQTEPQPWDSRQVFGSICLPCGLCSCCCGRCIGGRCFGRCIPPSHVCPRDATPVVYPDYFHAVCDDMIQVYMDGIYTPPVGGARPWPYPQRWKAYTYVIPPGTQVIAVSCLDVKQRRRYLVGSFSNGKITNSADWKCNDVRESAWQTIEYNDSWWVKPIENAVNDGSEGYNYTGIDSSAKLIWTGSYVSTYPVGRDEMFCRFKYTAAAPAEDRVQGKPLPAQPN